ncbi:GNAT family N-acetyltransferase [Chloroflexi bacterium TSY]|nr:GNAT family N-acetyltransferase [Chloroflexi bacterium TSY]
MHILETERLILRRFTMDDLDEIYRLVYADRRVKDGWSGAQGTPEEIKERFADRWILPEDDLRFRAVVIKQTNTLIGLMGFQIHEPEEGDDIYYLHSENEPNRRVGFDPNYIEVELTYALGHDYWKRGYATEMGKAIIVYGFEELGIGRIIQGVMTSNPSSINLMRRLGFRIEKGTHPGVTVGVLDDYERWQQSHKV